MLARASIHDGAISTAQEWLDWSAWLDSGDGATDLLRASCFRWLREQDRWQAALTLAEKKGAPASLVRQEETLGRIQGGQLDGGVEGELAAMTETGVPPDDLCTALVTGCLVTQNPARAKLVLDTWGAQYPEEAQLAYLRAVYWLWMSEVEHNIVRRRDFTERARQEFERALAKQPRHELARAALVGLLEDQSRLEEAAALAADAPASEAAALNLARLLRGLGRLDDARRVLEPLTRQPQASVKLAAQMAELELESGHYQAADRWFARAAVETLEGTQSLVAAACSSALQENPARARQLIARSDAVHNRKVRMQDLSDRLAVVADDPQTQDELRRWAAMPPGKTELDAGPTGDAGPEEAAASTASGLYTLHCSGCHGENGDGDGRAARHLFPKPRDFRASRSRLVSTVNGVPTLEDLEAVIRRGMPGTSMRAFDQLTQNQRMLLAQEVRRLNRLGTREQFIARLRQEAEEDADEHEVRQVVELSTTPGDAARVPRIGPAEPQAIARGRAAYLQLGCKNCHGEDGTGVWDLPLFDENGRPAPPRDLVHEAFKGGPDPETIYLRVLLGMPGTPHPACPSLADEQRIDLVQYCRSLSREPKRSWSNHQRAVQAWTPPQPGNMPRANSSPPS